jgi:hypothetical protein
MVSATEFLRVYSPFSCTCVHRAHNNILTSPSIDESLELFDKFRCRTGQKTTIVNFISNRYDLYILPPSLQDPDNLPMVTLSTILSFGQGLAMVGQNLCFKIFGTLSASICTLQYVHLNLFSCPSLILFLSLAYRNRYLELREHCGDN